MKLQPSTFWRRLVTILLASVVLSVPLAGCGTPPPEEKTADEIEQARQEHGAATQRELDEG